jgi:DNA-binding response OmpR family regulator
MTVGAIVNSALLEPTWPGARISYVQQAGVLSFPPFRLDLVEERLWKGTRELPLRRKPFAILRYLTLRPRRLVTRSEIVETVWGGRTAMSDSLLRTHIHYLRQAMGESIIETVFGRGYRFMATVNGGDSGSAVGSSDEGDGALRAQGGPR